MARLFLILVFFGLTQLTAIAQTDSTGMFANSDLLYHIRYKGGDKKIRKILTKNLKYPPQAIKDSVSGTVYVSFTIDTNGHSTDIQIIKGVQQDIDAEAIRCVDLLD